MIRRALRYMGLAAGSAFIAGCTTPATVGEGAVIASADTLTRISVCSGQSQAGYIKVDDSWDPTRCGNPTSISYNVWVLERFDNKPPNAQMQVCFNYTVPAGWSYVGASWDPTKCGRPTFQSNNVMTIRRS